jgi:glycosyltransferase involved in cell wall biosynthesis
MRVSFLLPDYPWKPVGGYRVVYDYANGLTARGHLVSVVHPRRLVVDAEAPMSLRRRAGLALATFRPPRVGWHRIDPRVDMRYVRSLDARSVPDGDVVVATAWQTAECMAGLPARKGAHVYLIQHHEVWSGDEARVNTTWRLPCQKIVIARWLHELGRQMGIPEDEMLHIPNGIDHSLYRVTTPIEDRPPLVAMMYSPLGWKRAADGIRALEMAKERHPALSAVLFGAAPRPADLPAWIDYRQGLSNEEVVSQVYNRAAIYLCSSPTEGWHLPPAEAMACGCALVSTDIGGVRDYAIPGRTALLAPTGDVEGLARHIVRLCEDPKERHALARDGLANIRTFTWPRSTDAFEAVLQGLAGRSP